MDPLRLVSKIPGGLEIPRLRDRLVHIIADFRTQTSLREGCNSILHHDCLHLAQVHPCAIRIARVQRPLCSPLTPWSHCLCIMLLCLCTCPAAAEHYHSGSHSSAGILKGAAVALALRPEWRRASGEEVCIEADSCGVHACSGCTWRCAMR